MTENGNNGTHIHDYLAEFQRHQPLTNNNNKNIPHREQRDPEATISTILKRIDHKQQMYNTENKKQQEKEKQHNQEKYMYPRHPNALQKIQAVAK